MTWNYRLVYRKDVKTTPGARMGVYAIHEVYYDDNGKPDAVTQDAISICGETINEVWTAYRQMSEAFAQPVLDYNTRRPIKNTAKKVVIKGKKK